MVAQKSRKGCENGGNTWQVSPAVGLVMALAGSLLVGIAAPGPVSAEEEWRVGGMLQIPFGGSKEKSFVHFANTRIGVKVQYAEVDDIIKRNEQTVERVYQGDVLVSETVVSEGVVNVQGGDKVIGGEGYLLVAPFNGFWDVSGGINGFAGKNVVQGAAGIGYDPSFGGYVGIGALLPYSQAGVRFNFRYIDYFVGATSLPQFTSKKVWEKDKVSYKDISQVPTVEVPPEEIVVEEIE